MNALKCRAYNKIGAGEVLVDRPGHFLTELIKLNINEILNFKH